MSHPGQDLDALAEMVDGAALQLRTRDRAGATAALAEIRTTIPSLMRDGVEPPRLSAVAPLPDGPIMRIDDIPDDALSLRRIIDLVDEVLVESELDPGIARLLPVDGLSGLDTCRGAVVARLFPEPRGADGRLSSGWIDLAAEWVFGDQSPDAEVSMRVLGVEVTVPARDAGGILHGCARARAWCDALTGRVEDRIRTASISFGSAPHVAVAAGGPRCDTRGLLARFELLAEVAREFEDAAYLCVDFESTFGDLGTGLARATWPEEGGAPANAVAGSLVDRAVPEVYPLQVLGPGHLARLAGPPPRSEALAGGSWLVPIGHADQWLPGGETRDEIQAEGRDVLAPLLLTAEDLDGDLDGDADEVDVLAPPAPRRVVGRADLPALDDVVIEAAAHGRRSMQLTALELAAWIAGEPHTDAPASVSPVLRSFVRELGAGLDDDRRQRLAPLAELIVGTGDDSDAVEEARCWLLADRLLRVDAPAWLRVAGLTEAADRLDALETIIDETQMVRGVDLVGNAVTTASQRLEITESLAADDAEVVDEIAWEVWEEVSQRTGWSAAADAMTHGIPGALTFATDQRVMELSRDPDQRAAVTSSTRGLGDEVWSTALAEVAGAAWSDGWRAAESLVHHESTFSLHTTIRRSFEARVGSADDPYELLQEEVDDAARQVLSRLILVGDGESDYWDRGVAAAATVHRGPEWLGALDDARDVLGPALYDEAIDAARRQLASWSDRAPRLVSRAVVASVTREACSVAGRSVAARAAAQALARGADVAEATAIARRTIIPLVDALADDAVDLIRELVAVEA